jgi:diadenosine tetraphosphatase ApaH/serine/threonine PP2A family protein phosphatase
MDKDAIAVFSDVHSNLEALEAVLADMDALGVERRVCLGDIVGYGANPAQCLELVRSLDCPVLKGNHDEAVSTDIPLGHMRDVAEAGIEFSRRKLSEEQKGYLAGLSLSLQKWGCEFVHASLNDPEEWNYVTDEREAARHFRLQTEDVCFCGHTHKPMVWEQTEGQSAVGAHGKGRVLLSQSGKVLINVGSVGQPRDLTPDACYAVYFPREHAVEFRRVPYDVAKAKRKILRAKLPRFLAQRLNLGR